MENNEKWFVYDLLENSYSEPFETKEEALNAKSNMHKDTVLTVVRKALKDVVSERKLSLSV